MQAEKKAELQQKLKKLADELVSEYDGAVREYLDTLKSHEVVGGEDALYEEVEVAYKGLPSLGFRERKYYRDGQAIVGSDSVDAEAQNLLNNIGKNSLVEHLEPIYDAAKQTVRAWAIRQYSHFYAALNPFPSLSDAAAMKLYEAAYNHAKIADKSHHDYAPSLDVFRSAVALMKFAVDTAVPDKK